MSQTTLQLTNYSKTQRLRDRNLWFQWVGANMIGEIVGLGAGVLIGIGLLGSIETAMGTVAGAVVGAIHGLALIWLLQTRQPET